MYVSSFVCCFNGIHLVITFILLIVVIHMVLLLFEAIFR